MNIKESDSKYKIENMGPGSDAMKELFNKQIFIYEQWSRFWASSLSVGKKCMNYMRRDIFTPEQRKYYRNIQEKIPVEPQEMKQVIDSLVGQVTQTVRTATVTMEDGNPPPTVARPETVAKVLKFWQNRLKVQRKCELQLRDGLITGYPVWLWIEQTRLPGGGTGELAATRLQWDSTLSYPYFNNEDGSDINELIRLYDRDYDEMYRIFPERKEAHKKHLSLINDEEYRNKMFQMDDSVAAEDRNNIIYNRISSATYDALAGKCLAIERFHPVYEKVECFVNEQTADVQVIPPEWPGWKYDAWMQQHPEYDQRITTEIPTLYVTTISSDGFVWQNKEHWFQENGRLPGVCYVADMVDKIPTGKGYDMLPYILQIAVSETEALAQVRTGAGTVTVVEEGSLKHPSRFESEMSRENGVITTKKGHNPDNSIKIIQRIPNDTFHIMADRAREQLADVHSVNDATMGRTNARQSNRAKQTDLSAGLNPNSPYVLNYAEFHLNFAQLLCDMMPYGLTEQMIIEIEDEYGKKEEPEEVNVKEFNVQGEAHIIANDLNSIAYRVVPVPGDDSKTTRESELVRFTEMLEAIGNTLFQIDPSLLGTIFSSWPNYYARQAGESLRKFSEQQQQQQQSAMQAQTQAEMLKDQNKKEVEMERINKPRFNFRMSPQDLNEAPIGTKLFLNMLNAMNQPKNMPSGAPNAQEALPQQEAMPQEEPEIPEENESVMQQLQ